MVFLDFSRFPISRFDRVEKSSFLKGFAGQLRANSGIIKKGRFHNGFVCIMIHDVYCIIVHFVQRASTGANKCNIQDKNNDR